MARVPYVVLGRAPDCDVVVAGPSVSARHARLRWQAGELLLEDLGSSNGTFVDGSAITRTHVVRVGQDVRLGVEMLPWDEPSLRAFLRHGASDTIVAMPRFGRYRCTKCKKTALVPVGLKQGELHCTHCGTALLIGPRPRDGMGLASTLGTAAAVALIAVFVVLVLRSRTPRNAQVAPTGASGSLLEPLVPESMRIAASKNPDDVSEEERSIRDSGTARKVMEALDAADPTTRNLAVQVAAKAQGPFHAEQVAAIWLHVRARFQYVNDPRGSEYFARASETIADGFAGDCDDFAITLASMVSAVGGRVRVVIMDGPRGGHAYAETCLEAEPTEVAKKLRSAVRKYWDKRLGATPSLATVSFRSDASCPVWLNLDWNANVPGGPYGDERWAVAIESDGATETLTPADAPVKKPARK